MDLMVLTDPELVKVGERLNGGTFGKDPCRLAKLAKVAYLRECAKNLHGENGKALLEGMAQSVLQGRKGGGFNGAFGTFGSGSAPKEEQQNEIEMDSTEELNGENEGSSSTDGENEASSEESKGSEDEGDSSTDEGSDSEETQSSGSKSEESEEESEENEGCSECGESEARCECGSETEENDSSEEGSESENDSENEGSDDSQESEESENDSFRDQDEENEGNPKDSESKGNSQQQQQKEDEMEARVREIVRDESKTLEPSIGEGLKEGFEELKGSIEEKLSEIQDQKSEEPSINEEKVREIVKQVVEESKTLIQPPSLNITFPKCKEVSLEGKHPLFPKLLALCSLPAELRQPIMLVGPAGSGKSYIAKQVSETLGKDFGALSLSADMTRGSIEGRVIPIGEGRYIPSEFMRLYESGGVYLFDEIDAGAAEVLVTINAATANGGAHVEARAMNGEETFIPKHSDTQVLAAANTFGTGPTADYVGRAQMDAATLDRFLILYMDYDKTLLRRLFGLSYEPNKPWIPLQRTEEELQAAFEVACNWIDSVYDNIQSAGLRRVFYIREGLKARACLVAGFTWEETKDVLLAGWDPLERSSVDSGSEEESISEEERIRQSYSFS